MTENLLSKIEDKVITLVSELEDLRKELHRVRQENASLKTDKTNHTQKLQGLIALLETIDGVREPISIQDHASFTHGRMEEVAAL